MAAWYTNCLQVLMSNGVPGVGTSSFPCVGYGADAALAAVTATAPAGTQVFTGLNATAQGTYTANSYTLTRLLTVGIADCPSPIKGFMFTTPLGIYQMILDASIPKDSTNKLTLPYTLAWTRR